MGRLDNALAVGARGLVAGLLANALVALRLDGTGDLVGGTGCGLGGLVEGRLLAVGGDGVRHLGGEIFAAAATFQISYGSLRQSLGPGKHTRGQTCLRNMCWGFVCVWFKRYIICCVG